MGSPGFTQRGYEAGRREFSSYIAQSDEISTSEWCLLRLHGHRAAFTRGYLKAWADFGLISPHEADTITAELAQPHWLCHHHAWWFDRLD